VLFTLANFVLLSPARVQFLVQSVYFVFLLRQDVIDLNFDLVAPLLPKLGSFLFGKLSNGRNDTINLRVALQKWGISVN